MLFDNLNSFSGKKATEDRLACYWYNQLWSRVMALYEWKGPLFEGKSATLNSDYLEWSLLTQGQACFMRDKQGKLRNLKCTRVGFDPYGYPVSLESVNPVLGNIKGTNGVDAVWIRNNKFAQPVIETIKYYAGQLAKIQCSLNVNLNNIRMTKVFFADNDPQANQIRKMQDDVSAGKEAVIVKKDLMDAIMNPTTGKIPVYSTPSEYLVDKLIQNMRSILNDFFITFGIQESGANVIKSQYNNRDEVAQNNQEIVINRDYWLAPRKEAAKLASELFNTEITVDIKQEEVQEYELQEPELSDDEA